MSWLIVSMVLAGRSPGCFDFVVRLVQGLGVAVAGKPDLKLVTSETNQPN